VILYDIPGRTGVPIKYETILRLAKHPNILAIKDAKGDFSEVSRVLNQTDLMYFSGDDANVLPHLAIGATGLIGVTANIAAGPYRTIVDAVNRGDLAAATAEHKRLEPLVRAVMTHVPGTVSAKYILHGLGRISSPRVRLPLVGPEEWEAALIEDELAHVRDVADFSNFRPDRNAAAGGALPKVHGTTR
jgi:4-hydroxy-tetrahydrodipicolinate synthase